MSAANLRAAEILEREAEGIRQGNAVFDADDNLVEWSDDGARVDHDEMLAIAAELRDINQEIA